MKQTTKLLLLLITVSIIGVGMPAAFSLGSGQHQFNQIDPENPDAFCEKCHGASDSVKAELASSGNGIYNGGLKIHSQVGCADCHALTNGYGTSTGDSKNQHAATIPTCIKCHGGTNAVMGFNVARELNNSKEAHNAFGAEADDVACIGCHTGVAVSGSVSYTYSGTQTRFGLSIGN